MRPEGLSERKTPLTPSGIESATFRLVPQCLKQLQSTINTRNKRAYGSLGMGQVLYFRTCKDKEKLQKGNEKKTAHRKAVPLSLSLSAETVSQSHRYTKRFAEELKRTIDTAFHNVVQLNSKLPQRLTVRHPSTVV